MGHSVCLKAFAHAHINLNAFIPFQTYSVCVWVCMFKHVHACMCMFVCEHVHAGEDPQTMYMCGVEKRSTSPFLSFVAPTEPT